MEISLNTAINTWLIFWITYWIVGGILTLKGHFEEIRPVTHLEEVLNVLFINMGWTLLSTIFLYLLPIRSLVDIHIIFKFILSYIVTELWFYHTHIFAHHPSIYKHLHKLHHKFKHPYALTALFCTGYEAIIINTFAGGLGPVLFQMETPYIYFWFVIISINATVTHSGYKISYLFDGTHDLHHTDFNCNYGTSIYLDKLYGTYKEPSNKIQND